MYRKSSKGNPYHDARGRFTSAGDRGVKQAVMWSSFGDREDVSQMKADEKRKLDTDKTDEHMKDGQRFYHNQSIDREKFAKTVASVQIPKGLTMEQRKKAFMKANDNFRKENAVAIRNGGQVLAFVSGNNVSYQIVESDRIANETSKKRSNVTRNTSTSMKQFHGYTVEYFAENEVRSCKKDASLADAKKHLSKFCSKYKKKMTDVDVCIKAWRNDGQLRYMPSYHFESEADAKAFAASHKGAKVINHDDQSKA